MATLLPIAVIQLDHYYWPSISWRLVLVMELSPTVCYLRSVKTPQKKINLPHKTPVFIGRTEETGITDIHVSRNHLECTADLETSKVLVKTLGKSYSGCNGYALMRDRIYTLKHGDIIEIRLGFHEFDIIFESVDEPLAKKSKIDSKWEEINGKSLLIFTSDNCTPQSVIAGFDLDGTLIKPKAKDPNDWLLNINSIPQKLRKLAEEEHKIVIFTNLSGLGTDFIEIESYKKKIEAIVAKLSVPAQVFIATDIVYCKPAPTMWNTLTESHNGGITINLDESFYVGNAAGRKKSWAPKKTKDQSICDRLFALNLGLKFYTPEEFFLKSTPVTHVKPEFDPRSLPTEIYPPFLTDKQEVVVMVGCPVSGKSFFCRNFLVPEGYVHVNPVKLGTWQKCAKLLEDCIQKKQSVVIDNTNPDKETRQRIISVAKRNGIDCRCFVMTTSLKHCKHNNRFREITDKNSVPVGDLVLNSYKKSFQEPELAEGFVEIVKIPFVPKFDKAEDEKLYKMFLLEN